jgi:predicted nucleic acid-binding protein
MVTLDANVWVAAMDPEDRFHDASIGLLSLCASRAFELHGPSLLVVEVGCAVARRTGSPAAGESAVRHLRRHPTLTLHPMTDQIGALAAQLGTAYLLRGADAIYVATAATLGLPLVTWDEEVVRRGGAVSPPDWLTAQA